MDGLTPFLSRVQVVRLPCRNLLNRPGRRASQNLYGARIAVDHRANVTNDWNSLS